MSCGCTLDSSLYGCGTLGKRKLCQHFAPASLQAAYSCSLHKRSAHRATHLGTWNTLQCGTLDTQVSIGLHSGPLYESHIQVWDSALSMDRYLVSLLLWIADISGIAQSAETFRVSQSQSAICKSAQDIWPSRLGHCQYVACMPQQSTLCRICAHIQALLSIGHPYHQTIYYCSRLSRASLVNLHPLRCFLRLWSLLVARFQLARPSILSMPRLVQPLIDYAQVLISH